MECEELAEKLTDMMEGDLAEEDEAAALEHLASCSRCEAVLAETDHVVALARDHGRVGLTQEDKDRMQSTLLASVEDSPSD